MEERLLAILRLALKYKASDIHILLKGVSILIEIRINGEMRKVKTKYNDDKLVRYLCYLCSLDLGKQLQPQTNDFNMVIDGEKKHLRFATILGHNYSNSVLRFID